MALIPIVACAEAADALSTVPGNGAAAVVLVIGTEHWDDGEYTLRVAGDGAVSLVNKRAGVRTERTAKWDVVRVRTFVEELRADGFLTVAPPGGPRKPGDVPLQFRVEGPTPYEAHLWEGDRYTLPGVDRIVTRLDALTRELGG